MTPVGDWDWRAETSETTESEEMAEEGGVKRQRRQSARTTAAVRFGERAIGGRLLNLV